ncbi:MAG: hypothetical protein A2Z15_03235 [Chloroflexi bacterium RBG_16_50_11]|nr:MAG: hypothetical protein A2Z15_03235 [Chloroflexi bacterium RBG_16_50_11]
MNDVVKKQKRSFFRKRQSPAPENRLRETVSGWGSWWGWVNVVLVFVSLEIAVLSIEQAHWITPQPSLSLVLFFSVLVACVLVRIRIFGVLKPILALVTGLLVTAWQTLSVLTPPESASRFSHLLDIIQSWLGGAQTLLPGDDKMLFVVFIAFLTWVIGYLSVWFVLRRNNSWVAVTLGALVILFNLSNLPDTYYIYFFLYFFAAVLLLAVTRMTGRFSKTEHAANYSGRSLLYLGASLLCITVLAASLAWITPQVRATGLQDFIAAKLPWQRDILESKFNIFNAVPSKQALSTAGILKDLPFSERWNQGDEIEFIVYSERPSYWLMNTYDTYTSQGWTSSSSDKTLLEADTPWAYDEEFSNRETMKYAVTAEIFTDVLLTNGGYILSDLPVRVTVGAGGDVISINALRILSPGEQYTVTSYVSSAVESSLSGAGEAYPDYVKSAYLQLPSDMPGEIKLLSENVTGAAKTPYAKVTAIVDYLSQFPYKLEVDALPEGSDSVAYFLFNRKNGFCLHFASAAVVMLRSIGVPSRLVVGYLPGEPGRVSGQYLLRDKFYHAWPQVYFPGYGWIDIEATPGRPDNQVAIDTPLVSSSAIERSPQWDAWLGAPPPEIQNAPNFGIGILTGDAAGETDSLSFAAKLGRALLIILAVAVIIALIIGIILVVKSFSFRWLWRVDRKTLAYETYLNMCKLAAMVGLIPRPQQTPLEFTYQLAKVFPQEAEALDYIAQAYVTSRFGGRGGKPALAEEAEILKARHLVYNTLLQRLGMMRRLFGKR